MKNRLNKKSLFLSMILIVGVVCFIITTSWQEIPEYYTARDFIRIHKTDVHFHYNTKDLRYLEFASSLNFRLVSPNVDSKISINDQLNTTSFIRLHFPEKFAFFGTFSVDSFGTNSFVKNTINRIKECMQAGASGIKIWKNIGMVLKDKGGRYVMVDDTAFDSVFQYLEENKIPVLGHLGEPKNCWLPLNEMTDSSNYRYYRANPQYHMFLHPEAPSYEDQINARDNLLKKHPGLDFTGAHLASLEWSVDEIAKRLDMFPNLKVELSARIAHLQSQSIIDREKVRNFMIKYQDRLLYGTDVTILPQDTDYNAKSQMLLERWRADWIYLVTDSTLKVKNLSSEVKGLQLSKKVIDKIFNKNADRFFN